MAWTGDTLGDYVRLVDLAGGPGSPACDDLWQSYQIEIQTTVDQSLDPFGESYVAQQLALYEEIAGHAYDASNNEVTEFDIRPHVSAPNPYNHPEPGALALHLQRLSRALRLACPQRGQTLVDLGCGWGLSSELAAYVGLTVRAIDINHKFIDLIRARAALGSRDIKAERATFESFAVEEPADLVLFYESLHHAVRPWQVLRRIAACLKPGGKLVIAGEPINDNWWRHWGIRLDPESVYCIRKFGWFESGWSMAFLLKMLVRQGWAAETFGADDPLMGDVVIATKPTSSFRVPGAAAPEYGLVTDTTAIDADFLSMVGRGEMRLIGSDGVIVRQLTVASHRCSPLRARFWVDNAVLFDGSIDGTDITIDVPAACHGSTFSYDVEGWVPHDELSNGDHRRIGVHLRHLSLLYG